MGARLSALAGLGFYATLPSLLPPENELSTNPDDAPLYLRNSRLAVAFSGAGALGLSLGGRFQLKLHRLEVEMLPKDRRFVPDAVDTDVPGLSQSPGYPAEPAP